MDGPKLKRTKSSLLRASPTIHSFSSITDGYSGISQQSIHEERGADLESGEKEEKQRRKPPRKSVARTRTGLNMILFNPIFALVSLSFSSLLCLFLFFCWRGQEILTSENLLLVLVFVAVALFLASKHMALINRLLTTIRQICEENSYQQNLSKPVQWFIGEIKSERVKSRNREGVEFSSNGDFYEGEFHKGKCNGSGGYNYVVNGRYEGDWVDGRYDGYGIESWARGSRYKGQYRQGLRCGNGVYRFYTGDCYAGEWFNGQSHGLGVQTCSDGSSYVGEFKLGVKHGLGCYHFRYVLLHL